MAIIREMFLGNCVKLNFENGAEINVFREIKSFSINSHNFAGFQ